MYLLISNETLFWFQKPPAPHSRDNPNLLGHKCVILALGIGRVKYVKLRTKKRPSRPNMIRLKWYIKHHVLHQNRLISATNPNTNLQNYIFCNFNNIGCSNLSLRVSRTIVLEYHIQIKIIINHIFSIHYFSL